MAALNNPQKSRSAANVFRVASGNFLEMYDFMVFGFYAVAIGKAFFPNSSDFISLMQSFMTFAAGFLMRPLGALVLGAYMDRHGRKSGLILTLALMAVGTISIAFTPGYATLGLIAPLLVVLGRLLEGFSAGVELGGVSIYLAEIATPGRKGFFVSWQSASQQVAVVTAALIGVLLTRRLSPQQMTAWGWRVPLALGCAIVPLLFLMRRSLSETESFESRKHRPEPRQIFRSIAQNWRLITLGMLLTSMTTVSFYTITTYTPSFGTGVLHLSISDALLVTLCTGASNFLWLPVMGSVSDRVGRMPLLLASTLLMLATAYPALLWLAAAPGFGRLLLVQLWFSFLYGSYNGAMVVFLTEIMPTDVRTTGFSLAYSLATALFGGLTPAIATYLVHRTGNKAMPGVWLSVAAACALLAALLLRRHNYDPDGGPIRSNAS